MIKKISCILLLVLATQSCKTNDDKKEEITGNALQVSGKVTNASNTSGSINIMGFVVEPKLSGTLNNDGSFSITLPDNFTTISQEAINTYNQQDEAAYNITLSTGYDMFINLDNVTAKGLENTFALAGKYYGFEILENGVKQGALFPTTSTEFINTIVTQQTTAAVKGAYYYFIYADNPATVTGTNTAAGLVSEESEETFPILTKYDISIQKGWNILKYEVLNTIELPTGETIAREIKQSSIKNTANFSTNWIFIN